MVVPFVGRPGPVVESWTSVKSCALRSRRGTSPPRQCRTRPCSAFWTTPASLERRQPARLACEIVGRPRQAHGAGAAGRAHLSTLSGGREGWHEPLERHRAGGHRRDDHPTRFHRPPSPRPGRSLGSRVHGSAPAAYRCHFRRIHLPVRLEILLAARNEGIGDTLTTSLAAKEPEAKALFGIPDGHAVATMLPIGKPVRQLARLKRKSESAFSTADSFGGTAFPGDRSAWLPAPQEKVSSNGPPIPAGDRSRRQRPNHDPCPGAWMSATTSASALACLASKLPRMTP